MKAYERLLRYVAIDTTSDGDNPQGHPSTARQFDLAKVLVDEMQSMGFEDPHVDEHCYVYGWLPASPGCEALPALGLISHLDTVADVSGANVTPILHYDYDGGEVRFPDGRVISPQTLPDLTKIKGETLITSSGDTLLGADDKAGIADILTACEEIMREGLPHPRLCIAFTPDEEIGAGPDCFDVEKFGAAYAYTVDGCDVDEIEYETFNAASAVVSFTGHNTHPGLAKDLMVNASLLALEFADLLPSEERPEHTEGYQGFYHLTRMSGNTESAKLEYIIRDHDRAVFEARKDKMKSAAKQICDRYGEGRCAVEIRDSYYNMREVIEQNFHLVEHAIKAVESVGLKPVCQPVRGGTDGARLSYMGLPCPNLGTGAFQIHSANEFTSIERLDKAVAILRSVIGQYAE